MSGIWHFTVKYDPYTGKKMETPVSFSEYIVSAEADKDFIYNPFTGNLLPPQSAESAWIEKNKDKIEQVVSSIDDIKTKASTQLQKMQLEFNKFSDLFQNAFEEITSCVSPNLKQSPSGDYESLVKENEDLKAQIALLKAENDHYKITFQGIDSGYQDQIKKLETEFKKRIESHVSYMRNNYFYSTMIVKMMIRLNPLVGRFISNPDNTTFGELDSVWESLNYHFSKEYKQTDFLSDLIEIILKMSDEYSSHREELINFTFEK